MSDAQRRPGRAARPAVLRPSIRGDEPRRRRRIAHGFALSWFLAGAVLAATAGAYAGAWLQCNSEELRDPPAPHLRMR